MAAPSKRSLQRTAAKKAAAAQKKDDKVFTTSDGREIRVKAVDPIFIQNIIRSVEMPEPPTYEVPTVSGRVEVFEVDEEMGKDPEYKEVWQNYMNELLEATADQTDRSMRAIFLDGTVMQDVTDKSWERRMKMIRVTLAADPEERWIQYLLTSLSTEDMMALSSQIMRLTGVSEELVQGAEDSFRDSVLTDDEPEGSEVAGPDTEGTA